MTSARGFKCVHLFVSDKGFIYMVPMVSKGKFPKALKEFCKEVGVPRDLIVDPFEVEFPDGHTESYAANMIAEASQRSCDDEGNRWSFIESMVDHHVDDEALKPSHGYTTRAGKRKLHKTTRGVSLACELADGSTQWFPLKELKESDPVSVASHAEKNGLIDLPAFAWWVPFTLKKKKHVERAVIARVRASKFKYGLEVPTSIKHAEELDAKNDNHFWKRAIAKEMDGIRIAFDILEDGEPIPAGYTKADGCIVFDIKLDFTRKA